MNLLIKKFLSLSVIASCLLALTACAPSLKFDRKLIENQEFIVYHPEKPKIYKFENGLTLYFIQNNELPLVNGTLYLKGGFLNKTDVDPHLLSALGSQIRQGGAGQYSAEELDLKLESLAAAVESDYGGEMGNIAFTSLASDVDEVFSIFSDVVLRPNFDAQRLHLWREQNLESINRRSDSPTSIASIAFKQLLFDNTVLGKVSSRADINAVQRIDLLRLHREFVRPNGAILAVTGAISEDKLIALIEKNLGEWKRREHHLAPAIKLDQPAKYGIFFIEKPFKQATIAMGKRGPQRHTADQYALDVFNPIFGSGGFSTRLMTKIRVQSGYAYSTAGAVESGWPVGRGIVYLQTKSESTGPAFAQVIEVIDELKSIPVPDQELKTIKKAIANSFIFSADSPGKVVSRSASMKLFGYPEDYHDSYLENITKVSAKDVQNVANNYWSYDDITVIVVGNADAYKSLKQELKNIPNVGDRFEIIKLGFDEKIIW